jgi:hypothetical protein
MFTNKTTQPERYSRSRGQHDLSVQIRRIKTPRQKFDYQSCGPRRYLQFGHVEGPIRVEKQGDMTPEISVAQSVRNQNRLSSKTNLEILSSFPMKAMNTKVGVNFVPYDHDTEFALFGDWTW